MARLASRGPALRLLLAKPRGRRASRTAAQPAAPQGFKHRGFYLHEGWLFKHPFVVRSWKREDFAAMYQLLKRLGFDRVMNWPMFESIPAPLSDAATKEDIRLLRGSLDGSTSRLEVALAKLADKQARTEARLDRLEAAVERLAEAQVRTESQLERLTAIVEKLVIRTDRHEGTLLELVFRDRLPSYLGLFLRRAKVLQTADAGDIERAARRAALLRKAELPAVGLVACETVQPQTLAYAREQGVKVLADGRFVDD